MAKKLELLIESEQVRRELQQYNLVKLYHQRGYDNAFANLRMYYGKNPELGMGQYDLISAQRLLKSGRHLVQQNFILPLIDAVAGAMMQMKFNADYIPVSGKQTSLTELPNKMIFSDKEMMNWDFHILDLALKGLLHDGAVKLGISDKWDSKGNITLTSALMNSTFPDPRWKTAISSECENVWHDAWLSPEDILRLSKKDIPELMDAARRIERDGMKYGDNTGVVQFSQTGNSWGSLYRVVERYYLTRVDRKATYIETPEGDIEVPRDIPEEEIGQWLTKHYPDWKEEQVYEKTVTDKISKLCTFCPTLYGKDFIQNEETEIQVGATPWKFWSASRLEGEPRGLIESVKDSQTYVNYWAGLTTHKIQSEGGGGAQYSNPEMFENNTEWERWRKFRNNPLETFKIKMAYLEKGISPSQPVTKSEYPAEVYKSIEFFVDKMLPKISKVTPAFLGQQESSGESGYLYRQKKLQADLQTYTIVYGWRLFWNDLYESYLMQAPQTYGNEGIEREFPVAGTKGKERFKVNEVVDVGGGMYGIKNDMRVLRNTRHAVIISDKPDSPTDQAERLVMFSETVDKFAKIPGKETSTSILLDKMVENMSFMSAADKALMEKVGKMEAELAVLTLETNLINAKAAKAQADQQLQMMTAPAPAMPGAPVAPGGPAPVPPGAEIPPIPAQISPGPRPVSAGAPPLPTPINAQNSAGGPV